LSVKEYELLKKLYQDSQTLEEVTSRIFQGIKTSADKIYIVEEIDNHGFTYEIKCPHDGNFYEVESALFHRLIKGGDSKRYYFRDSKLLVLFPYSGNKLIEENIIAEKYPLTYKYLLHHKKYLENREKGKMKDCNWYGYVYPKALDVIGCSKIFTPDIAPHPSFMIDTEGKRYFTGGAAGGYGIVSALDNYFLLGILNSSLTNWYIAKTSTQMRGGWYSFESRFIKSIPIKQKESQISKLISETVERILFEKEGNSKTDISVLENQIDQLVYQLYDLTEEEIEIIENPKI
jgi:adenine-specific DNA-methyltransferase